MISRCLLEKTYGECLCEHRHLFISGESKIWIGISCMEEGEEKYAHVNDEAPKSAVGSS